MGVKSKNVNLLPGIPYISFSGRGNRNYRTLASDFREYMHIRGEKVITRQGLVIVFPVEKKLNYSD